MSAFLEVGSLPANVEDWYDKAQASGDDGGIDAVVTWVDGGDPLHRAKREHYLATASHAAWNGLQDVRFFQSEEIRFCLRSIRNHAPWIDKIWLVTDAQIPAYFDPDLLESDGIYLVDHKVFMNPAHLPTFNSLSIETQLWRIPGLADRFLYFNDDIFLTGPTRPEDFFTKDGVALRGKVRDIGPITTLHGRVIMRGAVMAGAQGRYLTESHVPYPMFRDEFLALEARFRKEFRKNSSYRFRSKRQFSPISLHDHTLALQGRAAMLSLGDIVHIRGSHVVAKEERKLRRRLRAMSRPERITACIADMTLLLTKVPDAHKYLDAVTGPRLKSEI